MAEYKKLSLKEEVNKEAEQIEREVLSKKELDAIEVTQEQDEALAKKIREFEKQKKERMLEAAAEMLTEEDIEILRFKIRAEEKPKVRRMPLKRKVFLILAAVMLIVLGMGMTSVGSKSYWKQLWERFIGKEEIAVSNVEDMDRKETEDGDELTAYREIEESFGVVPVQMMYKPRHMVLDRTEIDEEQRLAKLFYTYEDYIITYSMYVNNEDSSRSHKVEDEQTDAFTVENMTKQVEVKEYAVAGSNARRYVSNFEYRNVQYQLMGVMKREEFEKIVENLEFF